jgi:hypothetical protein
MRSIYLKHIYNVDVPWLQWGFLLPNHPHLPRCHRRPPPAFPNAIVASPTFPGGIAASPTFPSAIAASPTFPSAIAAFPNFSSAIAATPTFPNAIAASSTFPSSIAAFHTIPSATVTAFSTGPSPILAAARCHITAPALCHIPAVPNLVAPNLANSSILVAVTQTLDATTSSSKTAFTATFP